MLTPCWQELKQSVQRAAVLLYVLCLTLATPQENIFPKVKMKKRQSRNPSDFLYSELPEQTNTFMAHPSGKAEKRTCVKHS